MKTQCLLHLLGALLVVSPISSWGDTASTSTPVLQAAATEAAPPAPAAAQETASPALAAVPESAVAAPGPIPAAASAQAEALPNSVSDAADKAATEANKASINSKVRNPTLRGHLLENIDVFGKNDLPAIYILGPGIEDFEGQLLTRDFARDPFFMQNIDREEFEMKMWLHGDLDEDEKKEEKTN